MLLCLVIWGNQFILFKEFFNGDLIQFNKEMYNRYELINNCNGSDCYLPTIKNKSQLLFVYPLVENPNSFQNMTYQKYFNTGRILIKNQEYQNHINNNQIIQ